MVDVHKLELFHVASKDAMRRAARRNGLKLF